MDHGTATVARKKTGPGRPRKSPDQHLSTFMVRLPERYRDLLEAMEGKTGRPWTHNTRLALEKLAKELGVEFTPSWPDLL